MVSLVAHPAILVLAISGLMAVAWAQKSLDTAHPFETVPSEITEWIPDHQLSGWVIDQALCPPHVRIISVSAGVRYHTGAVYDARPQRVFIAESEWQQPRAEGGWNACHELVHITQQALVWQRLRLIKGLGECLFVLAALVGIIGCNTTSLASASPRSQPACMPWLT